jgi:hypothetical protein
MLVFFSSYLYGFYFTGLGVMIGIIWVDLCKGLNLKETNFTVSTDLNKNWLKNWLKN